MSIIKKILVCTFLVVPILSKAELPSLDICQVRDAWNGAKRSYQIESISGWITGFWGDYYEEIDVEVKGSRSEPGFYGILKVSKVNDQEQILLKLVKNISDSMIPFLKPFDVERKISFESLKNHKGCDSESLP